MLTRASNTIPLCEVVYHIPCSCSQVYIGETRQRLKEHCEACKKGTTENWTSVLDYGRGQELLVKEAVHIQTALLTVARAHKNGRLE